MWQQETRRLTDALIALLISSACKPTFRPQGRAACRKGIINVALLASRCVHLVKTPHATFVWRHGIGNACTSGPDP